MSTNVDRVQVVIPELTSAFTLDQLMEVLGDVGLNRSQVSKALRSLSYVKVLGNGQYRIRGRRTVK